MTKTDQKLLDGVKRIKTLALAEADVLSRKGLSRSERVARKAKIEAYSDALAALAGAHVELDADACPGCGKRVSVNLDGSFRLHREPGTTGAGSWGKACVGSRQKREVA